MFLSRQDVFSQDGDVRVSVRADLFVMETQNVEELVLHGAQRQTTVSLQGQYLSCALTAQVRVTPCSREDVDKVPVLRASPDEADAGAFMKSQHAVDDEVTLLCVEDA